MSSLKNAAIILLGMGETCAAEVLKALNYKDVEAIIDIMNNMEEVSEEDVIKAMNEFFNETKVRSGLAITSGDYIHNTLVSAIGVDKAGSLMEESSLVKSLDGIELLKWQPNHLIHDILQEEHPQIITVALACLDSNKSAEILSMFPIDIRKDVVTRMMRLSSVSQFAMETLSEFLVEQFTQTTRFKVLVPDVVGATAKMVARLDSTTESEIIDHLNQDNKELSNRLQEKLFPFEKLADFDSTSLKKLLQEVNNDQLVLALKGADEDIKDALFKCMSNKSVDLIKEDMELLGPTKIQDILSAQKNIVEKAKALAAEDKISIPSDRNE